MPGRSAKDAGFITAWICNFRSAAPFHQDEIALYDGWGRTKVKERCAFNLKLKWQFTYLRRLGISDVSIHLPRDEKNYLPTFYIS